jgi:hypothetical protein
MKATPLTLLGLLLALALPAVAGAQAPPPPNEPGWHRWPVMIEVGGWQESTFVVDSAGDFCGATLRIKGDGRETTSFFSGKHDVRRGFLYKHDSGADKARLVLDPYDGLPWLALPADARTKRRSDTTEWIEGTPSCQGDGECDDCAPPAGPDCGERRHRVLAQVAMSGMLSDVGFGQLNAGKPLYERCSFYGFAAPKLLESDGGSSWRTDDYGWIVESTNRRIVRNPGWIAVTKVRWNLHITMLGDLEWVEPSEEDELGDEGVGERSASERSAGALGATVPTEVAAERPVPAGPPPALAAPGPQAPAPRVAPGPGARRAPAATVRRYGRVVRRRGPARSGTATARRTPPQARRRPSPGR